MKTLHEILAVKKNGIDYSWFNLMTVKGETLTVYESKIKWIINEDMKVCSMNIITEEKHSDFQTSIRECEILGNSKQIKTLLNSIGWSTSEKTSTAIEMKSLTDEISQLKMAIYELKNEK